MKTSKFYAIWLFIGIVLLALTVSLSAYNYWVNKVVPNNFQVMIILLIAICVEGGYTRYVYNKKREN